MYCYLVCKSHEPALQPLGKNLAYRGGILLKDLLLPCTELTSSIAAHLNRQMLQRPANDFTCTSLQILGLHKTAHHGILNR